MSKPRPAAGRPSGPAAILRPDRGASGCTGSARRAPCPGVLGAELLVELALPRAEPPGNVHDHGHIQAAPAVPAEARQAFAFDRQHVAWLCSGRHRHVCLPVECRNGRGGAKHGVGYPDVQVVAQVGARPGEPGIGAGPVITYASPGGPLGAGLGIPRPPSRSAVPSGTPRGMRMVILSSCTTCPLPSQARQGWSMTCPRPRQAGQVVTCRTTTGPRRLAAVCWPVPPQSGQGRGAVPGSAPLPAHRE